MMRAVSGRRSRFAFHLAFEIFEQTAIGLLELRDPRFQLADTGFIHIAVRERRRNASSQREQARAANQNTFHFDVPCLEISTVPGR